ncbi:DNA repair protein complementing XP-C cells homolog isoform X1 [Stomoxys calcitrans]|uniref:DNA repair protein complementing XP-C cells homolog isoform X1 n=1 Tax=Stomoxys calcitrans TaxID=35570 RepID=UPI0027E31F15|nr:DNA repair protein complementing XP-C cells homolog isoform X1 [Stomoxys calcitrans]
MSDEESISEGFSASEDEWKPSKEVRGGESSDDDDSDFEESSPIASATSAPKRSRVEREPKARSSTKQVSSKKKPGQSLRAKLYNKYRPLPKTFSPPSSDGKNSPSASTSRTKSKNAKAPNESNTKDRSEDDGSSSDGSIDNYLVDPEELDIQSSFFNVSSKTTADKPSVSPVPDFDCNAGLGNLSDSASDEDENNVSVNFIKKDETKAFDFRNILENVNSLERVKESLAKQAAEDASKKKSRTASNKLDTMDVYSLLALGEKQHRSHNDGEDEDDEEDDEEAAAAADKERRSKAPSKLSKTKSTRVKRHTKTRPASTLIAGGDTDDSEFEEVADTSENADTTATATSDISHSGNLEIHIELPSNHREKKTRTQQDLEMALKRKFNRDMKERQLLIHKASLLCHFGRTYYYNRLLNDTILMQKTLKLLPSKNAYPSERGTEIKYYQSLVTWFKGAITLNSQNLYPDKKAAKNKAKAHSQLLQQIEKKQARCKQDMVFIFVILLRGMGLQCRLVNNLQPLALRPSQSDLISMKTKQDDKDRDKKGSSIKSKNVSIKHESESDSKQDKDKPGTSSKAKTTVTVKDEDKGCKSKETLHLKPKQANTGQQKSNVDNEKPKATSSKASSSGKQSKEVNRERTCPADYVKSSHFKQGSNPKKSDKELSVGKPQPAGVSSGKAIEKVAQKKEENSPRVSSRKNKKIASEELIKPQLEFRTENSAELTKPVSVTVGKEENIVAVESSSTSKIEVSVQQDQKELAKQNDANSSKIKELANSQKENKKTNLNRLKRGKASVDSDRTQIKKLFIESGTPLIPTVIIKGGKQIENDDVPTTSTQTRVTRSRSKSPQIHISTEFLQSKHYKEKFPGITKQNTNIKNKPLRGKSPIEKVKISPSFLSKTSEKNVATKRILRSSQKTNEVASTEPDAGSNVNSTHLQIPQLDGADDDPLPGKREKSLKKKATKKKKTAQNQTTQDSDEDFEPSPVKRPKMAPSAPKRDRRVLSTDEDEKTTDKQKSPTAADMWVEVWSDVEEQWICVDIFKGKVHSVDSIRKSASSNMAYVFAFQNDLSVKDVTARYSTHWTTVVRKSRIDKSWLDAALNKYRGHRTSRDIKEDQELRRIHEEKPMPTSIGDYKNHPFYALERHLLKFEALYPPTAPTLGFIRGEAVYSRDCVHTLHSRDIWLKQARVVKLGEKPYKIVKARPKWDRITQTVIKDQPLEIFGFWQTEDYDPPTAENGIVPRNAYGNVELFKPTMLPKKCVHIRLPGLNRICKKLGVDCANAVVGFDFHQGACHPTYDGFVICEEFQDQVTAAWYQDQEDQERKEQEKYEARVYGNWKKLIRGLLIRERLKLKYDF